jgi:RimJ/RimL family protein N-acetyltransferase
LLATDDRTPQGQWLDVPILDGDGLRLRPWLESDVPRIVEACTDERTRQWLPLLPHPYGEADARAFLASVAEARATGRSVCWAVVDQDDDSKALASISFFDYTPETECEIGYWAHPDARSRGVTSRAMEALVRYCFEDLGVRRVSAAAATGNAASIHVIESAGLRRLGRRATRHRRPRRTRRPSGVRPAGRRVAGGTSATARRVLISGRRPALAQCHKGVTRATRR